MPDHLIHNQVALVTPGTAVQVKAIWHLTSGITIKALADNAGTIYIGGVDVDSTNGFPLAAGDLIFIELKSLPMIYIDGTDADDAIAYIGG